MRDWDLLAVWLICSALALFFAGCAVVVVADYRASAECLRHGFPQSQLTLSGAYCVRRRDQTDEVVPLRELRPQR